MLKHISEYMPPVDRDEMRRVANASRAQDGAHQAQELLRAAVAWHQRNEDAELPIPLLAILVAARRVC